MTGIRDTLLQRISQMRATAESTNSEAEALLFAEKAASMMAAYEISEAELAEAEADGRVTFEIVETLVDSRRNRKGCGGHAHRAAAVAGAINTLTHTKSVQHHDSQRSVSFLGHKPDVEFAVYLYALVRDAMDREYANWREAQTFSTSRTAKGAFQLAMASRLSTRIYSLARKQREDRETDIATAQAENAAHGDASASLQIESAETIHIVSIAKAGKQASMALTLVDTKEKEVNDAYAAAHPQLGTARGFSYSYNGNAATAGQEAGNRVGFNRGVNGAQSARISA